MMSLPFLLSHAMLKSWEDPGYKAQWHSQGGAQGTEAPAYVNINY